jgi:hypothetical protein
MSDHAYHVPKASIANAELPLKMIKKISEPWDTFDCDHLGPFLESGWQNQIMLNCDN